MRTVIRWLHHEGMGEGGIQKTLKRSKVNQHCRIQLCRAKRQRPSEYQQKLILFFRRITGSDWAKNELYMTVMFATILWPFIVHVNYKMTSSQFFIKLQVNKMSYVIRQSLPNRAGSLLGWDLPKLGQTLHVNKKIKYLTISISRKSWGISKGHNLYTI